MTEPHPSAEAVAVETGAGPYQLAITAAGHTLIADEPVALGGLGSGPNPFDLLASALAACTTMTLRMYATRKAIPVTAIRTAVSHTRQADQTPPDLFTRRIFVEGDLTPDQRDRLLDIANRCPVHQTLTVGARVASGIEAG
jgi:putative redox protein